MGRSAVCGKSICVTHVRIVVRLGLAYEKSCSRWFWSTVVRSSSLLVEFLKKNNLCLDDKFLKLNLAQRRFWRGRCILVGNRVFSEPSLQCRNLSILFCFVVDWNYEGELLLYIAVVFRAEIGSWDCVEPDTSGDHGSCPSFVSAWRSWMGIPPLYWTVKSIMKLKFLNAVVHS